MTSAASSRRGVGYADDRRQLSADGKIQVRILIRQGVESTLFPAGDLDTLVLKDEVSAADEGLLPVHAGTDTVGNDVLHLGVHLFML